MEEKEIQNLIDQKATQIRQELREHRHNGVLSEQVDFDDIFDYRHRANVQSVTIGTAAGNYDAYYLAERTLSVVQIDFSAVDALATNDTDYITWTITNLGQAGSGTAALLGTETTKVTGGSLIAANTKRTFALTATLSDLQVIEGDRIRIRAAVTVGGTALANTVTFPVYLIKSI